MPDVKLYTGTQARAYLADQLGEDKPLSKGTWDSWINSGLLVPDFVYGKLNAGRWLESSLDTFALWLAVNRDPTSGYIRREKRRLRAPGSQESAVPQLSKVKLRILRAAQDGKTERAKPVSEAVYAACEQLDESGLIVLKVRSQSISYRLTDKGRETLASLPDALP